LGHQIIATAFGGTVCLAPIPVHGKDEAIFHHQTGLYQGLPMPFRAGRYHSLIVDNHTLPPDLLIEAQSSTGMIMGMRHARYLTFGVQFHPESILTPEGDRLLNNFIRISHSRYENK